MRRTIVVLFVIVALLATPLAITAVWLRETVLGHRGFPGLLDTPVPDKPSQFRLAARVRMGREGFEPSTLGLRVPCSTN